MAPGLVELLPSQSHTSTKSVREPKEVGNKHKYIPGRTNVEDHLTYDYDNLRPTFPDLHWAPLEEVPYTDKGLQGDVNFKNLLESATDVFDYTPKIGTEVEGVELANLTDAQKNDLARLIAIRGVVFFRNQENFDIESQRALGQYFGTLHSHATTSVPKQVGLEDVHVVYTDEKSKDQRAMFSPTFLWHSDVMILHRNYKQSNTDAVRSRTNCSRFHTLR
jgi:sulfonate dioxygenase